MTTSPAIEGTPDIPAEVFRKFLEELAGSGVSSELIARLRKTLMEDKTFTERVLKEAVIGEEPLP